MQQWIWQLNRLVWGIPALVLILGVGLSLTLRLGGVQFVLFPKACRVFLAQLLPGKRSTSGVSSGQALSTALAATVGTGNLVGVAGALCLGGPGAVFWMWICGLLGMATKYAEVTLAVRYRYREGEELLGGPMYIIRRALAPGFRPLATAYCLLGIFASFGVGNATQIRSALGGIHGILELLGRTPDRCFDLLVGVVLAAVLGTMLLGGAGAVASGTEKLVPAAAGGYILLCLGVLTVRYREIPEALASILRGAFQPSAVTGGMLGSCFVTLRIGCSRGVFTNEAGMGTASIAHAAADCSHPAEQGLLGMVEVFLDTLVICTMTALVILVSGVAVPYGQDAGDSLTTLAFGAVYGSTAALWLGIAMTLFAVATVLGWGLYGIRFAGFLLGRAGIPWFVAAQSAVTILATQLRTDLLWQLAELFNGLMAIPNLIALALMTPELVRLTREYRKKDTGTAR